ncbi:hypothetical protein ZIOFF_043567 [Zingiber officinale]|uniref:C3H1-type domain-containing protein n=1 Tax=Zingiber officinale TaxID=94328 RepID=A0A8J5FWT8_ZINOF|nr:hypothetical protein ZIOFF_043567 [Zingiber officinale]
MGFVEAKLVLNNDELPPSPSLHSLDVVLADVARLEVGEKPGNGVDAPGIAVAQANAGVEPDPGSPKKGVEEAEKEVPMQFPQRSEAPDCAFYMKTGACKFGSACKFNHPPKRRKPRVVRAKKGAENVQLPKNAKGKQKECLFKKDDKVEKQTSSRRLQQEDCKFQKNAIGKQMPPFKKFEQSEEKADQMERHWLRSEQDDSKFQNKAVGKQIPPFKKVVQTEKKADEVEKNCSTSGKEDSKIPKNFIGKQMPPFKKFVQIEEKIPKNFIGKQIPLKKFVQIEEKTDEVEKHCSMSELEDSKTDKVEKHCSTSELEDSKLQKNAIRKQKRLFKKFEQTEKKTDEAEKQCSMLEQEDREFQKNAIEKQIPLFKRFEQTEKKSDKVEKQSSRSEQEDSKADEVEKHSRWEQEDSKVSITSWPNEAFRCIDLAQQGLRTHCASLDAAVDMSQSRVPGSAIAEYSSDVPKTVDMDARGHGSTPLNTLWFLHVQFFQAGKPKLVTHSAPFKTVTCTPTSKRRILQTLATEKMSKEAISGNIGIGIPECKVSVAFLLISVEFYKTSGKCKYGKSCKYTHSLKKIEVAPLALNFLGLPVRPGEKECPYYICTGNCKYAANCKYHHPEPTVATLEQGALPACQIGGSEQQISCGVSSLPVTPSPTQGAFHFLNPLTAASSSLPLTECNGYQIDPKRPGETECQYHSKVRPSDALLHSYSYIRRLRPQAKGCEDNTVKQTEALFLIPFSVVQLLLGRVPVTTRVNLNLEAQPKVGESVSRKLLLASLDQLARSEFSPDLFADLLKQTWSFCSADLVFLFADLVILSTDLLKQTWSFCSDLVFLSADLPLYRSVLLLWSAAPPLWSSALQRWSAALPCRSTDLSCRSGLPLCRPVLVFRSGLPCRSALLRYGNQPLLTV